jgi:hypothetical protein
MRTEVLASAVLMLATAACSGARGGLDGDAAPQDAGAAEPVTLSCAGGGTLVVDPPATFTPMTVSGAHWPLLFSMPQVTDASIDLPFLHMLEDAGANELALMVWYSAYQAHTSRYDDVVSAARADGLKVRIGFKGEIASLLFGLQPTFATPPSATDYATKVAAIESELASRYHPDAFNLVEELGTSQGQVGSSFTTAEWLQIIQQLATAVKAASPTTETWVAILPTDPVDRAVGENGLLSIADVDGVGLDVYGNEDPCTWSTAWKQAFAEIIAAGKKTGLTETWWEDLYAEHQFDEPSNAPLEGDWLRAMLYLTQSAGATGAFMPWFTNKFVALDPLFSVPGDPQASAQQMVGDMKAALDAGTRTVVFDDLQAALGQMRAGGAG